MSTLDGLDLFSTGPHRFHFGPWNRQILTRGFSGLDGEVVIDQGLRSRTIRQTGRLIGSSAADVTDQLAAIQQFADGRLHTLVDDHGMSHSRILVREVSPETPVHAGREFWADYTLTYRQLP